MKYIYNYTEHSLNESFNSKEAKKQFLDKGLISKEDFTIIKKALLPKYVYWGCRERANPENKDVILDSIYDITLWFEKNKQYLKSKDLYTYAYEEIRLLMNDPSIGPKKKKAKGKGKYEILYEDKEGNILISIEDHTASVYWAHKYREGEIADGQWCTAAYADDSFFNRYSYVSPIYIVILPNEENLPNRRLCIVSNGEYSYTIYDKNKKIVHSSEASDISYDMLSLFNATDTNLDENLGKDILLNKFNINKFIISDINKKSKKFKNINKIREKDFVYINWIHLHALNYGMNIGEECYNFKPAKLDTSLVKFIYDNFLFHGREFNMFMDNSRKKLDDYPYAYTTGHVAISEYSGKQEVIILSKTKCPEFKYTSDARYELDMGGEAIVFDGKFHEMDLEEAKKIINSSVQ